MSFSTWDEGIVLAQPAISADQDFSSSIKPMVLAGKDSLTGSDAKV
jgi:hypothetical protein